MQNDSFPDPEVQALCERQRAWNADYYRFFSGYHRVSQQFAELLPGMLDHIARLVQEGRISEALTSIGGYKEVLIAGSGYDARMVVKHHQYVETAMGNYKAMAEVLRDYSLAQDDQDFADFAETQIAGINDFWLAAIADLDPERV
jgi:hypothetical protein